MVLAAVFNAPNKPLELKEFPKPEPGEGAILAKIISAGICGTDVHVVSGKVPWVPKPIILGHESVGIIEKLGNNVTTDSVGNTIKEGDRIYWALGIGGIDRLDGGVPVLDDDPGVEGAHARYAELEGAVCCGAYCDDALGGQRGPRPGEGASQYGEGRLLLIGHLFVAAPPGGRRRPAPR